MIIKPENITEEQKQDAKTTVLVYSGQWGAYWGPNRKGYTGIDDGGTYTLAEAYSATSHCDPSKKIEFHAVEIGTITVDGVVIKCRITEKHIAKAIKSQGYRPDTAEVMAKIVFEWMGLMDRRSCAIRVNPGNCTMEIGKGDYLLPSQRPM